MIINHNLNAMSAHRSMNILNTAQGKSMEKLNSGMRVNRAADDAAGLAISEKMRSQIRGLTQASRNAQDGISMIQTAEGSLSEVLSIAKRLRELSVQSSNGTYSNEDRELMDEEFTQLKTEIDRLANQTDFNGSKVLNGEKSSQNIKSEGIKVGGTAGIGSNFLVSNEELAKFGEGNFKFKVTVDNPNKADSKVKLELLDKSRFNEEKEYVMHSATIVGDTSGNGNITKVKLGEVTIDLNLSGLMTNEVPFKNFAEPKNREGVLLQVGSNSDQLLGFSIENMRSRELGLGGINVRSFEEAQEAIKRVDKAIERVSEERGKLGAVQNRLEHTIASADNTAENLQAAESRIRDVDMAKEMMHLTKLNVLQQASQSMLAQANQAPQQVLSILK